VDSLKDAWPPNERSIHAASAFFSLPLAGRVGERRRAGVGVFMNALSTSR
jgi:hypothetical protein